MGTDIGMINDFIEKEEQIKEDLFKGNAGSKHFCIFEISHPDKHSELYKTRFVDDYGEDYTVADEMCQSMNNFRKPEEEVRFCVRCLEQEEFDNVENYNPILKTIEL